MVATKTYFMLLNRLLLFCLTCFIMKTGLGQTYLTSTWGNSINVSLKDSINQISIPVDLKGVKVGDLQLSLQGIKSDRVPNNVDINVFSAYSIIEKAGKAFILLEIKKDASTQPGIYTLEFRINKNNSDSTQSLSITLIANGAEVKPLPSSIIIERNDVFFGFGDQLHGAKIQLRESGNKMPLGPVTLHTIKTVNSKNEQVNGVISAVNTGSFASPGGLLSVDFAFDGKFTPGKLTSTVEIQAPQLREPIPVTIEINSRRGFYLIITVILLGLIVGFFLRNFLDSKINLSSARLNAIEMLRVMDAEDKKRPDAVFLKKTAEIRSKLSIAIKNNKDTSINDAVNKAKTDLETAITDYNTRLLNTQQELDNIEGLVNIMSKLPPQFSGVVANISNDLLAAQNKNKAGDADSARQALATLKKKTDTHVGDVLKGFKDELFDSFNRMKQSLFQLPGAKTQVNSIEEQVNKITLDIATEVNNALLNNVYSIDASVHDLRMSIGRELFSQIQGVEKALDGISLNNVDSFNTMIKEAEAVLDNIRNRDLSVYELFKVLPKKLDELQGSLRKALLDQTVLSTEDPALNPQNETDRNNIKTAVNSGEYINAATIARDFIERNKVRGALLFADAPNRLGGFAFAPSRVLLELTNKTTTLQVPPTELQQVYIQTYKSWQHFKFWQTFLSGIVIVIIGCALYADSFTGTAGDIASVFMWAFLLDISVATITGGLGARVAKQ